MAIDVAAFVTSETTESEGTLLDDLLALNASATAAQMSPLAEAIADCVGRALQTIKDDADLTGVTSGVDTVSGGVD